MPSNIFVSGVDGKRATAANLARPQALTYGNSIPRPPFHLKQRQLFEAARDGRVWVVDRLLRKSSVKTQDTHGTLDINFQYRYESVPVLHWFCVPPASVDSVLQIIHEKTHELQLKYKQ